MDKTIIPLRSLINIEGFNNYDNIPILFYAWDVSGSIKGYHVDIFCGNKAQIYDIDSNGKKRKLRIIGFHKLKK